jgi:hypothetical protein
MTDREPQGHQDYVTTALETLGLLAVAGGVAAGSYQLLGWWAMAAGGVLLFIMSVIVDAVRNAPPRPDPQTYRIRRRPPGPEDPGPRHTKGP